MMNDFSSVFQPTRVKHNKVCGDVKAMKSEAI